MKLSTLVFNEEAHNACANRKAIDISKEKMVDIGAQKFEQLIETFRDWAVILTNHQGMRFAWFLP